MKRWLLTTRPARLLDFGLAITCLTYGVLGASWLWTAGGLLGLMLAWLDPATRVRKYLFAKVASRRNPVAATRKTFPAPPSTPYKQRSTPPQ